ncbi:hypothetical protein HKT18_02310 [Flavobacterium sp. IMCC34852]|uniref:Beta-carotene 15,15'-monooxygenase n=1 Tax=Flavobacterium rivulicola TaxID=2732161 RepID=A0A7Y3R6W5_9FLAO|nr:DUF6427 family protein [Flavobacterium sp. IMCC34852]NNT71039.1 hypothetical protein [Flavobacterium sp. IMCC34852]
MITSIFKKSSIVNYALVVILLLAAFFLHQSGQSNQLSTPTDLSDKLLLITLLLSSFFLVNFMVKKNGLTKNSSYTILFFLLFLMIFPIVFSHTNLLFANFFLLLAMRRLISLQTLKAPKEKIFDASMWIFIASLFHFWCILFIVLVYISIIFHVSRDYRNWLLPFVAFVTTTVVFLGAALYFDKTWIDHILTQTQTHFELDYFTNNYQNAALSFYVVVALYFLFSMVISLTNRPLILQASYKKMIFGFLIGSVVFILSPDKNNAMLLFTFFPLAVMTTNNIEYSQSQMYQEIVLMLLITGSFFAFFAQL